MKLFYGLVNSILCFLLSTITVTANTVTTQTLEEIAESELTQTLEKVNEPEPTQPVQDVGKFMVFPVGVNLGKHNLIPTILVRGFEDGTQAIDLENWLIPFDDVIKGLQLDVTSLEDGRLEVRSPGLFIRINPEELQTDPELGLVFSVADIQTLFGVPTEFDLIAYAIVFNPPWLGIRKKDTALAEIPVVMEGLPRIKTPNFTLSAVGQRVNVTGSRGDGDSRSESTNYQGDLTAVGTAFGGSWFIHTNQPDLMDTETWQLREAQFLRQTESTDYVIGSQPTFWRSQGGGNYWGATTIERWGFTPPRAAVSGGFSPRQRLQAEQVGRTISGEAEPGTLVQLTQGLGDSLIAEVLVDSSGVYRFEDIPAQGRYRLLLYPDGQLVAKPEIQEANLSTLPGHLPNGASALIVSAGLNRQFSSNSGLLGEFNDFRGGIAYRRGVSEDLTLGVGVIYDSSAMGLAELFYQPAGLPLQVTVSALAGEEGLDLNTDVRFQPSNNFNLNFNSGRFSERFNLNWRVIPSLTLTASGNTREEALAAGLRFSHSSRNLFALASATLDTNSNLRWSFTSRLGNLKLNHRGNEIITNSELSYDFSRKRTDSAQNLLLLKYETRNTNRNNDNLGSLGWRYRSGKRAGDGRYLWEVDLGYGIGSQGSGMIASASTAVIPGVVLRVRYQEVSVTSDEATFRIELLPSLNFQQGISPGESRFERLRQQGGLLISPFFDDNNNGKHDPREELYLDQPELLLILNNQSIESFRPEIGGNGIYVNLVPGSYRLDFDPSGFPIDWQTALDAYGVDVVAGSYTPVSVPLLLSYTISGVVTDSEGKAVAGARVEAIEAELGVRRFSITNGAGVYYLERLPQGQFYLQINHQTVQSGEILLDESSEPFQELNLQQPLSPSSKGTRKERLKKTDIFSIFTRIKP